MDDTFHEVEKIFTDEFYKRNSTTNQINGNICCNEVAKRSIKVMAENIKRVPEFATLSDRDIYIVLIFTFYSLRLNEQTRDWLNTGFLKTNLVNKELGNKLFLDIATNDITLDGQNFSSAIRRYILGLHGGNKTLKRRKKRKIRKTRKQKKRNNKSRKIS